MLKYIIILFYVRWKRRGIMNFMKEVHKTKSTSGQGSITYYIYKPLHKPKAIVQISHGMCEYLERYEPFIDFLTSQDILVCGNDHLGHKNSAVSKDKLGYFAPKDGWKYLVKDLAKITYIIKASYPNLPYFLFGHSMGSFIARLYISQYSSFIDGAIICGTSGSNPAIGFASLLTDLVCRIKGEFYRSTFIDTLMFGSYNRKYTNVKTKSDWISKDEAIVNAYIKDKNCTFIFTASAFRDLVKLLKLASSKAWYHAVPKNLPIFLISGDMDPVGNYGKGIREVERRLRNEHLTDLTVKLYKDDRHELINETDREIVFEDILKWILKVID